MTFTETEKPKISRSKYELTLAEFPFVLLSKRKDESKKCIEYKDTITGKDKEEIERVWKVFPHSELGFGTASTFSTLFELLQVWKEGNFDSQVIHFGSTYNLLKRKGIGTGVKEYRQITRDLDCLVGITIKAKNAFWDNERRAYVDMTFHLFDQVFYFKEKPGGQAVIPFAHIKASDVLYGSVLKNSFLTANFDSKFFHGLAPIEQRIALYLTKMFRSQAVHKKELFEFAHQIPLQFKEKKQIKQRLKKACDGLISKGFHWLKSYDFEKGSNKQEYIVFKNSSTVKPLPYQFKTNTVPLSEKPPYKIDALVEDILAVCKDDHSKNFYKKVAHLFPETLIYRMISEVKEVRDCMEIKKSKGAVFTSLAQKYAKKHSIDL